MEWIEPEYSKERVKKAGKSILYADLDSPEFLQAQSVFHNWRAAHAFPMQIMLDLLRKNSRRIDKTALVVQRLKRSGSIFNKLERESSMSLSRMEDIAGCRAVVSNTERVYKIYGKLLKSKTKNILYRERDYIAKPKESGYRGLHLVYKYNGTKQKYQGLPVELQIRSKVQHSWATAVEVVGAFTNQALKASIGDSEWLDFFKYTSIEFAKLENILANPNSEIVDHKKQLVSLISKLEVEKSLSAFNVAVQTLTSKKKKNASYYILKLNMKTRMLSHYTFNKTQLDVATAFYDAQEERYRDDHSVNLVMVSANSLQDLKRAYPNYFLDTVYFSRYLSLVINN
ncbi:RelA/SpoT domain-containing protein [Desulforhopalus sp. 52FAK]